MSEKIEYTEIRIADLLGTLIYTEMNEFSKIIDGQLPSMRDIHIHNGILKAIGKLSDLYCERPDSNLIIKIPVGETRK